MKLYPAVDILDKQSVRLLYGKRSDVTVYGKPRDMAEKFKAAGASILHVVDLNGAFDDSDINRETIKDIVKNIGLPVQLGGGIKSIERVRYAIEELGVSYAVLGTAAVVNPELIERACALYGDKIVCGIDVADGFVSIKGWVQKSDITATDLAAKVKKMGVRRVVFTDISRDGALSGVNAQATVSLQREAGVEVIASGGVRSLEDIIGLKREGVYGAILGRALYTGDIRLQEALKYTEV